MSDPSGSSRRRRRIAAAEIASRAYLPRSPAAQWWTRVLGDGTTRRRNRVWLELLGVIAFCTVGFYALNEQARLLEVPLIVGGLQLMGIDQVAALGTNIVLRSPDGYLIAALTPSCSALLSVLALTALAGSLFRSRGWRTVGALLVTSVLLVIANAVRIGGAVAMGTILGRPALALLHDWVGTVANFVFTLTGFVIMVWLLLPDAVRAEQDRYGRHTANRPQHWVESGLGYRTALPLEETHMTKRSPVAWMYRLSPRSLRARAASRREAERVDFRVGALEPQARALALRELVSDGLAVHAATLWAAASYETDPEVLDALADAVAARQWEPTVNDKVGGIRLWARAWLAGRPSLTAGNEPQAMDNASVQPMGYGFRILVTGSGGPAGVAVIRRLRPLGYWTIGADADARAVGGMLADSAALVPHAGDADYLDALLAVCRDEAVDAVIFTTVEEMAVATTHLDAFERARVNVWVPTEEALLCTGDKRRFAERMVDAGIPHPPTTDTVEGLSQVPGPWIVKPKSGRGSRGVHAVDDAAQVRAMLERDPDVIAQSRHPGREWTCDALIGPTGERIVAVPRWRDQTRGGISVMGTTFEDPDEIAAVTDIVFRSSEAAGVTGPSCVQGFVADDGSVTVVEINPRFSGGLPLTIASGGDVVAAYTRLLLDRHAATDEVTWHRGVQMNRYFAEIFHDRHGHRLADPATSARTGVPREQAFAVPDSDPYETAVGGAT